jgi:acetylornithine deacetylase/succinyl-diaminopimelate desuccinylase-like protein
MSSQREQAIAYVQQRRQQALNELIDLVRIPSISTDPNCKDDMQRTAEWLAEKLTAIGMQVVKILPTRGHPVVFAHYSLRDDLPTVLIYGHYDVQPVEPLDLWQSEPFEPTLRGENLYGRGASDMKGQVLASIQAVEAVLATGSLPFNVKFIIEGEEEIGSPNLLPFLEEHKALLAADIALNPDTGMAGPDLPTIVYALRGLAYFEIRLYGQDHDLHSGVYGGVVRNPALTMCELLASMHDPEGRVTLPGFYDRVRELSAEERAELSRLPMDEAYYLQQTGARALWGEAGFTPLERVGARPTLDVNGILSGFTGKGSKTVIPAWAMAKVSTRLVPDQDPKEVQRQLEAFVQANLPAGFRYEILNLSGGSPSISDIHHPATVAMAQALEQVWGSKPVFKREGGSVPVVADMQRVLGIDSTLTGFGLPDDNIHAPNEKLHLPTWYRGIESLVHFIFNYGGV